MERYVITWVKDSKIPGFDDYAIVHSKPIGEAEKQQAQRQLETNDNVVDDEALVFIVFLDPDLNTPEVIAEIKQKSFDRLKTSGL